MQRRVLDAGRATACCRCRVPERTARPRLCRCRRRVLFLIIALPLNLALLGLYCWGRAAGGPRRFLMQLGAVAAAAALATTLALTHYKHLVRSCAARRALQQCWHVGAGVRPCGGCTLQACAPRLHPTPPGPPLLPGRRPTAGFTGAPCSRAAWASTAPQAPSPTATSRPPRRGWTCCRSTRRCGGAGPGWQVARPPVPASLLLASGSPSLASCSSSPASCSPASSTTGRTSGRAPSAARRARRPAGDSAPAAACCSACAHGGPAGPPAFPMHLPSPPPTHTSLPSAPAARGRLQRHLHPRGPADHCGLPGGRGARLHALPHHPPVGRGPQDARARGLPEQRAQAHEGAPAAAGRGAAHAAEEGLVAGPAGRQPVAPPGGDFRLHPACVGAL